MGSHLHCFGGAVVGRWGHLAIWAGVWARHGVFASGNLMRGVWKIVFSHLGSIGRWVDELGGAY